MSFDECKYFLCAKLGKYLAEHGRGDLSDYDSPVQLAVAAYDCRNGCVDDDVFGVEELTQSIWCKFWYVFRCMLADLLEEGDAYPEIVIDACHDSNTRVVVIKGDRVVADYARKAWKFGHEEKDEEKAAYVLENLLSDVRESLEEGLEKAS